MRYRRRELLLGATAVTASASILPAPAIGQGIKEFKLVTAWGSPEEFPGQTASVERLVQSIDAMSEGRLKITVYPADSLVRVFEVFDAVAAGVADMYHVDEKYFQD